MKNHVDCIAKQLKWMVARNAMNMEKVDWSHFIINGVAVGFDSNIKKWYINGRGICRAHEYRESDKIMKAVYKDCGWM